MNGKGGGNPLRPGRSSQRRRRAAVPVSRKRGNHGASMSARELPHTGNCCPRLLPVVSGEGAEGVGTERNSRVPFPATLRAGRPGIQFRAPWCPERSPAPFGALLDLRRDDSCPSSQPAEPICLQLFRRDLLSPAPEVARRFVGDLASLLRGEALADLPWVASKMRVRVTGRFAVRRLTSRSREPRKKHCPEGGRSRVGC